MNPIALEIFGNLAFFLTTCAYMVRDMIKLRTISIVSSTIWLIYLFTKVEILWISVFWNVVFIAVNLTHIAIFVRETHLVELSEQDKELRRSIFPSMSVSDYKRLIAIARWTEYAVGETIIEIGKNAENVTLIVRGSARLELADGLTSTYGAGDFVGEVSFFGSNLISSATVTALEPLQCLVWQQDKLRTLFRNNASLRSEFNAIISDKLARKIATKLEALRAN